MKPSLALFAPAEYWSTDPQWRAMIVNGCGPGGWKMDVISDSLLLLNVRECCDIHDWMYAHGATLADKQEADRVLLNNLLRVIDAAGGFSILRKARRLKAMAYYWAVCFLGGPAFWFGKNPQNTMKEREVKA